MKPINVDRVGEQLTRRLAGHTSRRSLLTKLGLALVAAPVFPLLPVMRAAAAPAPAPGAAVMPDPAASFDRTGAARNISVDALTQFSRNAQSKDDTKCDYWRYCAIDGSLCTCCGGGVHTCPAGSEPSPVSWVGTCINPDDGKSYLIAYRDCCGKAFCGRCSCDNNDRETPVYQPQTNNNIIWCFGTASTEYHCSTAALVGPVQ